MDLQATLAGSFTFTLRRDGTLLVPLLSRFARPAGLVTLRQTFAHRSHLAASGTVLRLDQSLKVLGQTAVSTRAYIVQGGPKVPAAGYIWSLYFQLERVHQALFMKAAHTALVAKLVVVIDDNSLVLEATGGLLRSWDCCVVTAESCDDALVRLAETEADRRPDLIVCDYQLSRGLTGVGAIERLRSAFRGAFEIPALVISGDATSPQCEVGSRAYQLLYKPVNAEKFLSALVASVCRDA
jgi:CheY-like chemotaxis protein